MTLISTDPYLKQYQRLVEIARDLASTLELNTLLDRIIQAAAELSGSQAASILLYDEQTGELYFHAATNMTDPLARGLRVPIEGSIAGWVVTQRETAVVTDAHHDPRFFDRVEKATQLTTSSLIAVPMITKDKVIGALEVINKKDGQYSEADVNVLEVLAAQAAVAIENTRLFQQSDLISELVHEIRTPLTALDAAAYLLERPEVSSEQRLGLAVTIRSESKRLNELVTSFLDLARLESGRAGFNLQPVDVPLLLEECRNIVQADADRNGINLQVEIYGLIPVLEVDRDKIKQVLLNLLANGLKYNYPGGAVKLAARIQGQEVVMEVFDTGYGIPGDDLPHLFEKFYRVTGRERVEPGTGLGLSICKNIVESHNGRIEVRSQVGKGSVFTVYLPLRKGL